ncbi:MAG: PAS domain S-box protein [Gemmatimonadaceae bacterium]|nr:PAS domain S-box protein [Gemmatimonadaceae bacterium]
MVSLSELGRRSRIGVLFVIAAAVAMLGVLVTQTSKQGTEATLQNAVARQGLLSERLMSAALAARTAVPEEHELWVERTANAARDFGDASARLRGERVGGPAFPPGSSAARAYAGLRDAEAQLITTAQHAADRLGPSAVQDSLVSRQWRFVGALERVTAELESESERRFDQLVQVEAVCVILMLIALGLKVRLSLQPTELRLREMVDALAESEARLRGMLDAMDEGMLLTTADGRMVAWNPSALRILGIDGTDPERSIQALARQLIDQNGERLGVERLPSRVTIRTGEPMRNILLGVPRADGRTLWLSENTHPLFRAPGEPPYAAFALFRDVTDERQVEEERTAQAHALELQNQELLQQADALERGQALFRSLVDTAGSAIVGLDLEGRVFEWNREAEALFGVTRADAIGRPYAEAFVTPRHREKMRNGIAAVLAGNPLRNLVGPVKTRAGERRTVIWNITPLRASPDEPAHGLIAAGLDITEREASDERFRILFERSSDAHLLYDDSGVIDCNDATLRMLRAERKASVIGRSPVGLSPRRQPDGRLSVIVSEQMRQLARVRGYYRFEWVHERIDGSPFPVEVTLTPVRLNGRDVMLAVWHDIAERKAAEDALRSAKEAAESANRTKSEFMTRMNHELRTPLTAIIGFSRVLLQGREGSLPPGVQRYVERIRVNGMHLLSLINQILDVAKVEAGRMELEPEVVSVDRLVRDTLAMLEATAEAKGLSVRGELPMRVAPIVTDEGKLRQILINLIGNAIKFTEEGEVCVRVETNPTTHRPMSITVEDTGIGIPHDRQTKVFDPFEQGDSSTRRQFGGTGLGLSIVKTFAGLIGARIRVESEVGRGTSFTLTLPETDLVQDLALPPSRSA